MHMHLHNLHTNTNLCYLLPSTDKVKDVLINNLHFSFTYLSFSGTELVTLSVTQFVYRSGVWDCELNGE